MALKSPDVTAKMLELSQYQADLEQLRMAFEQYFLGIERLPPLREWDQAKRKIREIMRHTSQNTAYKFRRATLNQKLVSLNTYWERNLKQIEEGTHRRQKFLASVHERERLRQEALQGKGQRPQGAAASGGEGALSIDSIHSAYINARRQTGEGANISREKLAALLEKQVPAIKERFKCKSVDFKVAIENGKTKLKAVPKF